MNIARPLPTQQQQAGPRTGVPARVPLAALAGLPLPAADALPHGLNVQVTPPGPEFSAYDGRPGSLGAGAPAAWRIDATTAARLVERLAARLPLVTDYEHRTLIVKQTGERNPAAGWLDRLEWVDGVGLCGHVDWTAAAAASIEGGEYRYLSPVISWAPDGTVTGLHSLALTNDPALRGLRAAALAGQFESFHPEDHDMDLLAAVRAALGLPETATADEAAAAVAAIHTQVQAAPAPGVEPAAGLGAHLTGLSQQITTLSVRPPLEALAALQGELVTARARIAELERGQAGAALAAELEAALADGRLLPAMETWARALAGSQPDALRQFLAAAKPIAALSGTQTAGRAPTGEQVTALTAEELAVAAQLGLTPDQFRAARA